MTTTHHAFHVSNILLLLVILAASTITGSPVRRSLDPQDTSGSMLSGNTESTTSTSEHGSTSDKNLAIYLGIGIAAGVILLVLLIVATFCCIRRSRRLKKEKAKAEPGKGQPGKAQPEKGQTEKGQPEKGQPKRAPEALRSVRGKEKAAAKPKPTVAKQKRVSFDSSIQSKKSQPKKPWFEGKINDKDAGNTPRPRSLELSDISEGDDSE